MTDLEDGRFVSDLHDAEANLFLGELSHRERLKLRAYWPFWARSEQMPPPGAWRVWVICAGRGFGKTRAGAEWVRHVAEEDPFASIALVASSIGEAAG